MFPVVDVNPVDQETAFGDIEILGFEFMALPSADNVNRKMFNCIKPFNSFKLEFITKPNDTTVIGK